MRTPLNRFSAKWTLYFSFANILCAGWTSADLVCRPESMIANGNMHVCWKRTSGTAPEHLLIHFHGARKTTQKAFARSQLNAVMVIVNFPGLSSAYSKPFSDDARLFQHILDRAKQALPEEEVSDSFQWERISLSSFSAGYGAVREILKTPRYFRRINDIVAADSIYAGLEGTKEIRPARRVAESNMRDFLKFATLAVDGEKRFTISHSSQPTPYASTTETADYLLQSLNIKRSETSAENTRVLTQKTHASKGQFTVMGFAGLTGEAHLNHLHHIDVFWNTIAVAPLSLSP